VARLEPFYGSYLPNSGRSLGDHFAGQAPAVAEALLGITDDRAARSKNANLVKAYQRLRSGAKRHVEEAIPRIGRLVQKHAST
jgi:hypothetical protein